MENKTVVVRQANEFGIAGFVFSSVLIVYDGFLKFNCTPHMFSDVHLTEQYSGLIVSTTLLTASTIISIIGVKKVGQYQKGLALLGLLLNVVLWVVLIYTFCQGYFGGDGVGSFEDVGVGNRGIN